MWRVRSSASTWVSSSSLTTPQPRNLKPHNATAMSEERTRGGMWRVRSSASTCVSLSSLMKVSAHVWLVCMVMCM